ncbi:MAG: hypothetical protein U0325_29970 [Polyangiales bacterium]
MTRRWSRPRSAWSVGIMALAASHCDALVLDVGRRPVPVDAPSAVDGAVAPVEPSTCAHACVGGRRCDAGACLPHWLPIVATEGINDAPRVGHFTVWTGREVLVWGGRAPGAPTSSYGDGIRFDPQTGELRAMSRIDAPTARFQEGDTAVWTGQEMLVLGGRNAQGVLRDVSGYSPSLDRWRVLSTAGAARAPLTALAAGGEVVVLDRTAAGVEALRLLPGGFAAPSGVAPTTVRAGHSALWTGAEVIVWAGADESGAVRADGYRYVPSRARWRAVRDAGAANARRAHSAVWSSSEMLVFGGQDRAGRAIAAPVSYVPALDAWRVLREADAPAARYGHVAVWGGDAMLVWGGRSDDAPLATGAAYDPWDDVWTPLPTLPADPIGDGARAGRAFSAAVWTGAELIVLAGENGAATLRPYGWRYQP